MMGTTSDMEMVVGHDCDFCSHSRVCRIKFQVKDAIEMNKGLHLTITCDEYLPAMNPPVTVAEPPVDDTKEEKPKRKPATKKKVTRRKTK